jgi:ABC-type sugar transport system ATPase subunit
VTVIALRDVRVCTGAFLLDAISFEVPTRAFAVVVGAAGAGKTTLLEAIAGVRPLAQGTIHVGARNITSVPAERRNMGLVYQHGALFPHRSVMQNIAWASNAMHATHLIERLGIGALLTTPVTSLSGGERQLVALARALVRVRACLDRNEPALLLLDEPFSALDPRRRIATREHVRALHDEWALTTLQVTHDGADARRADLAILLDGGRIVQSGPPTELLRAPVRDDVSLFFG